MSTKICKCPFCRKGYIEKEALYMHMDKEHHDELHNLSPKQVYFNWTNKYALTKGYGKSVISGKPTKFNEITGRYERFLPEEKDEYRKYFLANMKRAGKEDIMKDMNHQKMMLANRSISGKYHWSDGTEFTYTGSYEKKFLIYLDTILNWPSSDLMAPAPQLFPYKQADGTEHVHIPDFYISSLNLIINVKSSENKHYRLRDLEVERAEDAAVKNSNFNYIKIYDNQFSKFVSAIDEIKENTENNLEKRVVIESYMLEEDNEEKTYMGTLLEEFYKNYNDGDEYNETLYEMSNVRPKKGIDEFGIILAVNPDSRREGDPYFKMYDSTHYQTANSVCRISFLKPEIIKEHSGKIPSKLSINSKEKKILIDYLTSKSKTFPDYTVWDFLKYSWNEEKNLMNKFSFPEYVSGEADAYYQKLDTKGNYIPYSLEMPDYNQL